MELDTDTLLNLVTQYIENNPTEKIVTTSVHTITSFDVASDFIRTTEACGLINMDIDQQALLKSYFIFCCGYYEGYQQGFMDG